VRFDGGQVEAAEAGHARHALPHGRQGIFGQVDEDGPGARHGVSAYRPRQGVLPVATLRARSKPKQVLEHLWVSVGTAENAPRRFAHPALGLFPDPLS
jgi:hypothetical protein